MSDGISDGLKDFPQPAVSHASALNHLAQQCGETARSKGFHQAFEDALFLEALANGSTVDTIITTRLREIAQRIRLLEVGMKSMLIVSEIAEGIESMRDTGYYGHLNGEGNWGEELADAFIRLADLADMTHVRLGGEVDEKMSVNKDRPHLHGKKA